jgi:hypothetical protein
MGSPETKSRNLRSCLTSMAALQEAEVPSTNSTLCKHGNSLLLLMSMSKLDMTVRQWAFSLQVGNFGLNPWNFQNSPRELLPETKSEAPRWLRFEGHLQSLSLVISAQSLWITHHFGVPDAQYTIIAITKPSYWDGDNSILDKPYGINCGCVGCMLHHQTERRKKLSAHFTMSKCRVHHVL